MNRTQIIAEEMAEKIHSAYGNKANIICSYDDDDYITVLVCLKDDELSKSEMETIFPLFAWFDGMLTVGDSKGNITFSLIKKL